MPNYGLIVAKDGVCYKFNPRKTLVEDVREGRCRQRYAKILELHSQNSTLTIHSYDLDEGEVVDVDVK